MSFLPSLEAIIAKESKRNKKPSNMPKSDLADRLDITRAQLVKSLEKGIDRNSPRFKNLLQKWRTQWFDAYSFNLHPDQEKKYLEVLQDRGN